MDEYIFKMIYQIDNKDDNLRILGKDFVKNNKNKCKLIVENRKLKLTESIPKKEIKNNMLSIKMILGKDICNARFMFKDCISLLKCLNFNNEEKFQLIDEDNIIKTKEDISISIEDTIDDNSIPLFKNLGKFQLNYIPKIKQPDEEYSEASTILNWINRLTLVLRNFTNLEGMFYNCSSLIS